MEEVTVQYVASYGRSVLRGTSFATVCDRLVAEGYAVHRAKEVQRGVLEIPHNKATRNPAVLRSSIADQPAEPEEQIEPAWTPEPIPVPTVVVGIQVRECGTVHPDGAVCIIPVFFETPACGCADKVYEHDGPHEAHDEYGVSHRWTEVLTVEDADFDCYSDRVDPGTGEEWAS